MAAIDREKLHEIYLGRKDALVTKIAHIVAPEIPAMVNIFYSELLGHPDADAFLNSELVATRLTKLMTAWIKSLFQPKTATDIDALIARQKEIGQAHARINIPLYLVVEGVRILRRELSACIMASDMDRGDLVRSLVLINEILDHVISLMNESYMSGMIANDRNVSSLRMQIPPYVLALDCERLRSYLFDWMRENVMTLFQNKSRSAVQCRTLGRSEFGLWVEHRAPFMFADSFGGDDLRNQVRKIDVLCEVASKNRREGNDEIFRHALMEMNDAVDHAAWTMSELIKQTLELESGRDSLTRVFNRRYLSTIMQHETGISMKHGHPYAVLLLDIDHFKKVNDNYGHDFGDRILLQFAEILSLNVRINDYVFRYGGEEFLILLGDMDEERAMQLAEKIREAVARAVFIGPDQKAIRITTSIGVALHDGHPDFEQIISRADTALYSAKKGGRNRCVYIHGDACKTE